MKDRTMILAAAMADVIGGVERPAAILVEGSRILAAGTPQAIGTVENASRVHLPDRLLLPALVNAHTHLDLTHLGPQPFCGSFVDWVHRLRAKRARNDEEIRAAVHQGVDLARRGGIGLLGDIAGAGSFIPIQALRESTMPGVSFCEVFGIGQGAVAAIDHINRACSELEHKAAGVELGLQPHAPYSCDLTVYEHAVRMKRPLATHLAETLEEVQFTMRGDGALAEMLRGIGVWDMTVEVARQHPVNALATPLSACPWIAAHCNYVGDAHIEQLAKWNTAVAYCPRASDYFGHDGKVAKSKGKTPAVGTQHSALDTPHRYRDMHEAGVRIALGTDSIVCLDRDDRISTLDDMRHLYRRDGTDPLLLLHMATVAGTEALGRSRSLVTFEPGESLGVIALPIDPDDQTDPLIQVMRSDSAPEWIDMSNAYVQNTGRSVI